MNFRITEWMYKAWYWYISRTDKNAEVLFMNYGYSVDKDHDIKLEDEANRFSKQLYHQLAAKTQIEGKDIIEVGSGRGGGLAFVYDYFKPSSALGIELNKKASTFCSKHYKREKLTFRPGDAQKLDIPAESCDVILNVESSHRYPKFDDFLKGAHRSLKKGGYLLITDFRYDWEMAEFDRAINDCELELLKSEDITQQVVNALDRDDARKRELINRLTPKILHNKALSFAGAIGSSTYNSFKKREFVYFNYILQKK